jgi:hypothetical protein
MLKRRLVSGLTAVAVLFSAAWCACAGAHVSPGPAGPATAPGHHCCARTDGPAPAPLAPQKQGEQHCRHCGTGGSFEMPRGGPSAPVPFDVVLPLQTPVGAIYAAADVAVPAAATPAERDTPPPTLLNLRCALLR